MTMHAQFHAMRGFTRDPSVTKQKLKPGTLRRIAGYARPYRLELTIFLLAAALDAVVTVAYPVLLGIVIDKGILPRRPSVVLAVAGIMAGLALFDAFLSVVQRYFTSRVGEGLIYDLRTQVFGHVQRQPIAFFTRAQTGSLVSRLNSDVIGAQQALTSTLSSVVSSTLQLVLVLAAMLLYSWQVTLVVLVLIPVFLYPARRVGRRLQRLTRESMQLDAQLGSTMTERFNVAGAMLAKLYGRPADELGLFSGRAARVRDIGVLTALWGSALVTGLGLLATMSQSVVYGLGGELVIHGTLHLGSMVALATLLTRLYGPITSLSNVQVNYMTALVSFDRVFEVLDLKPLIDERPGATALAAASRTGPGAGHRVRSRQLPVPDGRGGLAGLTGVDRPAGAREGRTGPASTGRRELPCPRGQAHRSGRPLRCWQDDDHSPGRADVRPALGRGADRRHRHQGRHAGLAP
jgi:ATP-binding cassette, subfamily B, bacterial